MIKYEEEDNRLVRWFLAMEILFIIVFTAFDVFDFLPMVADGVKLAGVILCFALSVCWLSMLEFELDRVMLMLSLLFAIAADTLLLFTDFYFWGVVMFCMVQEFHSLRIFSIKKSVVRMDGRITTRYQNYKVRTGMLIVNVIQLVFAAIPWLVSIFVEVPHVELLSVAAFYIAAFIGNLIRLGGFSRDVRLLDDMKPLKLYFAGMLLYVFCDIVIAVVRIPDFLPVFAVINSYADLLMLVAWPLYLAGMICISLSGNRTQKYYS